MTALTRSGFLRGVQRDFSRATGEQRWHRVAVIGVLLASLGLNVMGLSWGLPNGNRTWAADAIQPLTPLSIGRHVWFGDRWNSGWFYFKYPVGHPNLLLGAQAPFLLWMRYRDELGRPAAQYPHGFRNPEKSLAQLALVTRVVSALMGTACVLFLYGLVALYVSPTAGLFAAAFLAGSPPMVFYSHTSNVDVPLLFWLSLALLATVWSARLYSPAAALVWGMAMAMAMLTKEQAIGFLLALPLIWLIERGRQKGLRRLDTLRHVALAGAAFLLTTILVANVAWNPTGYFNRWRFLMGTLPEDVREKYAPYQFFTQLPQEFSLVSEVAKVRRMGRSLGYSMAPAVGWLVPFGGAALLILAPRLFVVGLILLATYYLASLRALELVPVRYTLPLLLLCGASVAGVFGLAERAAQNSSWRAWGFVPVLVLWSAWTLRPGLEVVRLMKEDPRYDAERWFATIEGQVRSVEVYQPDTYLPRFPKGWEVRRIPLAERRIELFRQRAPDLVVLSSGGQAGLVGRYARSWKPGDPVFSESDAARQFFDALWAGHLGYEAGPVFQRPTWLEHRINSLNPTIRVYRRKDSP